MSLISLFALSQTYDESTHIEYWREVMLSANKAPPSKEETSGFWPHARLADFKGVGLSYEKFRSALSLELMAFLFEKRLSAESMATELPGLLDAANPIACLASLKRSYEDSVVVSGELLAQVGERLTRDSGAPLFKSQEQLPTTLNPIIFSDGTEARAAVAHKYFPGTHIVRCEKNQVSALMGQCNTNNWLTIVVPTNKPTLPETFIESIRRQTIGGFTLLTISSTPSQPSYEMLFGASCKGDDLAAEAIQIPVYDQGPYDAMNLGIKLCRTPWIYFMGDDDELYSQKTLQHLYEALQSAPETCEIVYGNVEMQGAGPGTYDKQVYGYEFDYDRLQRQTPCHQGIFYRTTALRRVSGYDLKYPICSDWHLNLRLWQLARPRFVDTIVAKFNRGGLSSKIIDSQFFAELPGVWDEFQNPAH